MKRKILQIVKWLLFTGYLILLSAHIYLLIYCRASIITTFLFYLTLVLIAIRTCDFIKKRKPMARQKVNNWKFSIVLSLVLLFCLELGLKYIIGAHNNYNEKNGGFYYSSQYRDIDFLNKLRRKHSPQQDFWMWIMPPNYTRTDVKPEFHYVHTYNSLGLRDREFKLEKDSNEYRIIGLGDSFTEGVGTHQDSTWLRFLEMELNENYPAYHFVTLNGGCSGSDPFFEFMLLKKVLINYHPNLVIVAINNSDINDVMIRGGMERFRPNGLLAYSKGPGWEYIYAFSYIFRHFIHDVLGYNYWLMKSDKYELKHAEAIGQIYEAILKIKELTDQNTSEMLIVLSCHYDELLDDRWLLQPLEEKIIQNSELKLVNLYQYFKVNEIDGPEQIFNYYWKRDLHNTSKGYAKFAEGVAETIKRLGLINNE